MITIQEIRSIVPTGEFSGETRNQRLASRARWVRIVEAHAYSPIIRKGEVDMLKAICKAFIILDADPRLRKQAKENINLMFENSYEFVR